MAGTCSASRPLTDDPSALLPLVEEPAPLLRGGRVVGDDDVHVVEHVEAVGLVVVPEDKGTFSSDHRKATLQTKLWQLSQFEPGFRPKGLL